MSVDAVRSKLDASVAELASVDVRDAYEGMLDLDSSLGGSSAFTVAKTETELARFHTAAARKHAEQANVQMGLVSSSEALSLQVVEPTVEINPITLSLQGAAIIGTITDSVGGAIDGSTRSTAFTATYVPNTGTPDSVEWRIDSQLYRDDDIASPFNLRYNNDAIPIRTDFTGESAPSGQEFPITFNLDTGEHTITVIDKRGSSTYPTTVTFTIPEPVPGGGGGSAPAAGEMLWQPPTVNVSSVDWSDRDAVRTAYENAGYTIWNVGSGGPTTYNASSGEDVFINQTGIRTGSIRVDGARNVMWRGGHVNVQTSNGYDNGDMIGRFTNCTGIVHIEGVYGTGDALVEGFHGGSSSSSFELQVMNCFVDWIHGNKDINHSDPIQMYAGAGAIRVDLFTWKSHYQGPMMKADYGATPDWTIGRVNGYLAEGSTSSDTDPNGGGRFGWWNTGSINSVTSLYDDGNWCDENSQGGSFAKVIWNSDNGQIFTDGTGTYTEFQGSNQSGKIYQGVPPGGDWVNPANIGLSYANSDGYV